MAGCVKIIARDNGSDTVLCLGRDGDRFFVEEKRFYDTLKEGTEIYESRAGELRTQKTISWRCWKVTGSLSKTMDGCPHGSEKECSSLCKGSTCPSGGVVKL